MAHKRERLTRRRKMLGHTQDSLAHLLGLDRSTIVRWESGETEPAPWHRRPLAEAFETSLEDLDELLADAARSLPVPGDRIADLLGRPGNVDAVAVAEVRAEVLDLDARYDHTPSTALFAEAGRCLGQIASLRGRATGRIVGDLQATEAECATLVGQLAWDASQRRDHATARMHFRHAAESARQIGAPAAEGLALLREVFVLLYGQHDPAGGLSLARRTAETVDRTSNVLAGLALLHAAEAHAMLKDRSACEAALSQAESRLGRAGRDDPAAELFSPTQLGRLSGACYLALGDTRRAQVILHETATAFRFPSKPQAVTLGNLALAYAREAKIDAATATLHDAIDVTAATRGGGGFTIVFTVGRELRPWAGEPAVRDAHERLLALMAA